MKLARMIPTMIKTTDIAPFLAATPKIRPSKNRSMITTR